MKYKTFEEYLESEHFDYAGTDDGMSDAFDAWLTELNIDNLLKFANEYAEIKKIESINNKI